MDIGRSDSISADEFMIDIDAGAVLITLIIDTVLFCPASV
jgi:hypothetical protein